MESEQTGVRQRAAQGPRPDRKLGAQGRRINARGQCPPRPQALGLPEAAPGGACPSFTQKAQNAPGSRANRSPKLPSFKPMTYRVAQLAQKDLRPPSSLQPQDIRPRTELSVGRRAERGVPRTRGALGTETLQVAMATVLGPLPRTVLQRQQPP